MNHPPGSPPGPPQYGPHGPPPGAPQGPPPGYGPPPPGYGPPGGPPPPGYGPPGGPPPPPKKKGNTGLIVAIVAGGALLLLVVAAIIGVVLWSSDGGSDDDGEFAYATEFEGDWSGTMAQYAPDGGYVGAWDLEISLEPGSRTGTGAITVDGETCTVEYRIDQASGNELQISYDVTSGKEHCVETGEITLDRSSPAESLDAAVEAEWPDGTTTSAGILNRD